MRGNLILLTAAGVFLLVFAAFTAWATLALGRIGTGWRGLIPIWPYVAGGVAVTAALAGGLMWLAFFSANHGYDDGVENHDRDRSEAQD